MEKRKASLPGSEYPRDVQPLRVMNTVRTLLIALSLASAALADEVVLRNGSSISGVVREDGDRVVVEMDYGSMTFKKIDVKAIHRGEDLVSQFQEKAKAATDVKSLMELASWARDKGLAGRAQDLYRKVIALDGDQAEARKALGYEKVNGLWLSGDELMTAHGFVKVGGRWMNKDSADRLLEQEAQERIESDRAALERRVADQRHEQEMTKIGLERERIEIERLRAERDRWWWHNGWGVAPFYGVAGYILPVTAPSQWVPPTQPTVVPLGSPSPVSPARR
jgi:hypothetical protein